MQKKSGFSLIELLVVISIIAVLVAVLLPNMIGARERAADAKLKSKLRQFGTAMRLYYNDHGSYPTAGNLNAIKALVGPSSDYMKDTIDELAYYNVVSDYNGFVACVPLQNTADRDTAAYDTSCFTSGLDPAVQSNYFCVCWY